MEIDEGLDVVAVGETVVGFDLRQFGRDVVAPAALGEKAVPSEHALGVQRLTKAELQFKMNHGSERLLAALKKAGVYPFADLARASVPLELS